MWPGPGAVSTLDPYIIKEIEQAATEQASSYVADIVKRLVFDAVEVQTRVLEGDPAGEIMREALEDENVNVIAMATHGNSGFKRWVLGSVSEKVLHATPVPLLLVRPAHDQDVQGKILPVPPYTVILVPLDGSPFAEQALTQARLLAGRTGATLVLLSVLLFSDAYSHEAVASEPWAIADRAEAERMSTYLSDTAHKLEEEGLRVRSQLVYGYPPEEILRISEELHADNVVMTTHGRSGLQGLWLGSVALKVVQGSRLPVLVIRPGDH